MSIARNIAWTGKILVLLAALAFAGELGLGFFGPPGCLYAWFSVPDDDRNIQPRYVVVLGGGGIPSPTGLMRTYCAATLGTNFPDAVFIVALPADRDPANRSVGRMRDELTLRGIDPDRILMEHRGLNTHEQAVQVRALLGNAALGEPVLLVTSPFHLKRAVLSFRKAGFTRLIGAPTFERGPEADPGGHVLLRYAFWANLETGIDMAREALALAFYAYRGWI